MPRVVHLTRIMKGFPVQIFPNRRTLDSAVGDNDTSITITKDVSYNSERIPSTPSTDIYVKPWRWGVFYKNKMRHVDPSCVKDTYSDDSVFKEDVVRMYADLRVNFEVDYVEQRSFDSISSDLLSMFGDSIGEIKHAEEAKDTRRTSKPQTQRDVPQSEKLVELKTVNEDLKKDDAVVVIKDTPLRPSLKSCLKSEASTRKIPFIRNPGPRIVWDEKVLVAPTFGMDWYDRSGHPNLPMSPIESYYMYKNLMRFKLTEMAVHEDAIQYTNTHLTSPDGGFDHTKVRVIDSILAKHLSNTMSAQG
eukprot:CFRG1480T1